MAKVYKVDQSWFDKADKQIIGDMASTFCDSDESRTLNLKELIDETISVLPDFRKEDEGCGNIRILEIEVADIEPEDEEDLEYDYWRNNMPTNNWEIVKAIVVCSKEESDDIGLTDKLNEIYKDYVFM